MQMKIIRFFPFYVITLGVLILSSCVTIHPNQKLLVGSWKPESVEKYVDPNAVQAAQATSATPATAQQVKAKSSDTTGKARTGATSAVPPDQKMTQLLDRMILAEQRSTLEINANGTGAKVYHGKVLKAKWKLKAKGTRIVGKELEGGRKFVADILEISERRLVVIERTQIGDLKVAYIKQ
jgi:hypothetical protein